MLLSRQFPSYLREKQRRDELSVLSTEAATAHMSPDPHHPPPQCARSRCPEACRLQPGVKRSPCNRVQSAPKHCGPHVAPWGGHTGDSGPGVGADVVCLNGGEVGSAIKPPHHVYMVIQQGYTCTCGKKYSNLLPLSLASEFRKQNTVADG